MTQGEAVLHVFAAVQYVFEEMSDNPMAKNVDDEKAVQVLRAGLGTIRKAYRQAVKVLDA